jgi:hypothetical protein
MDITILNWMQGKSNETLSDVVLNTIAADRNIEDIGSELTSLSTETKDLVYADMLVAMYNLPSSSNNSDAHNGYSMTRQRSFGKRDNLLSIAVSIYKSYNDEKYTLYSGISGSTFKTVEINDLY